MKKDFRISLFEFNVFKKLNFSLSSLYNDLFKISLSAYDESLLFSYKKTFIAENYFKKQKMFH